MVKKHVKCVNENHQISHKQFPTKTIFYLNIFIVYNFVV